MRLMEVKVDRRSGEESEEVEEEGARRGRHRG
jgi:hypothetical protein